MARRGGGFPGGGGMGNMNNLMKQAQKMQRQMEEASKALEEEELTATAVDPDDIETLEDLIMAATNEALRQMDEKAQTQMSKITGGMGGGLPF